MAHEVCLAARFVRLQPVRRSVGQCEDFTEPRPVAVRDLAKVDPDAVGLDHVVLAALCGQNRRGEALDELLAAPLCERTEYARRTFGIVTVTR